MASLARRGVLLTALLKLACSSDAAPPESPGVAGSGAGMSGAGAGGGGAAGAPGGGGAGAGAGGAMLVAGAGAGGAAGAGGSGGASGSSGAAGMAGAGGTGGGMAYTCPHDPCRIMPLGDSITDGYKSSTGAGYRLHLFELATAADKNVTFVGSSQNGPDQVAGKPFPRHHEGHSGWTIDDAKDRSGLYPKIEGWLQQNPPDIVTLMIGTNDIGVGVSTQDAQQRLGLLLDRIYEHAPDTMIVLARIVPTTNDGQNANVRAYNDGMPALVSARTSQGHRLQLVDMYAPFIDGTKAKASYMADGLHPNDTGYAAMAEGLVGGAHDAPSGCAVSAFARGSSAPWSPGSRRRRARPGTARTSRP